MSDPDIWALFGLVAGTVGAILLGYDVIFGAGQRFQGEVRRRQLENLRNTRNFVRNSISALPQPPYTPADIKKLLDDEEAKSGTEERDLAKRVDIYEGELSRYEHRVVNLGLLGVLLIVVAFGLQAVGVIVHMREAARASAIERAAPTPGPSSVPNK